VLLLDRRLSSEAVGAGIDAALTVGSVDPALVAIEARRLADPDTSIAPVIPLEQALTRYERPPPTLGHYDALLGVGDPTDGGQVRVATVTPIGAGS
jgi:hypothetical protein